MNNIILDNGDTQDLSLKRANRELNVLYEVSRALRTTLELKHVLHIILTGVTSHSGLGYNRALLFLVNNKTRQLECEMAIGPESGEHADKIWRYIESSRSDLEDLIQSDKLTQTIDQSSLYKSLKRLKIPIKADHQFLLTKAFEQGTPWHVQKETIAQFPDDPLFQYFSSQEMVIMPLKIKDSITGLIIADNIYTQKPITDDELKIFSMLADQAALAIENSRLYELVLLKSHTDPVTQLWNHGFFQEKLAQEIEQARLKNQSLTLAMIDIDNFKALNDSFGHQHGDIVLREMAQIFRECSREKDFLCRYGGEEFSIILVETTLGQGWEIAERLRKKVAEYSFPGTDANPPLHLTVSIGLAAYPHDAQSKESLVAKADKAMYVAKFSGKNQTCLTEHH